MFSHARAFNQPLAALDVSQVQDMNSMFQEAIEYLERSTNLSVRAPASAPVAA